MSKTKNEKPTNKKSNPFRRSKTFQILTGVVFVALVMLLIFSNLIKNNVETKESESLKDYSAFMFKKQGELSFVSSAGELKSKIDIEIAENDESRAQGLMYRQKMNEAEGMLFIFTYEKLQSFWMRNTVMPLDIIFANKENEIVKIHKNTIPYDESPYASIKPSIYVVEVNAGYTDKFGISEGDNIVWRRL